MTRIYHFGVFFSLNLLFPGKFIKKNMEESFCACGDFQILYHLNTFLNICTEVGRGNAGCSLTNQSRQISAK